MTRSAFKGGGNVDRDEEDCNHHAPADSSVEDGGYHAPGYYHFGVARLFGHLRRVIGCVGIFIAGRRPT